MLPIRKTAERCGVSVKTAFFMRHRMLEIIEQTQTQATAGVGVELVVDETFFPVSFKGSTPHGREPRKRGKAVHTRGLSKHQLCVVTGITATGMVFYQLAGVGTLSRKRASEALEGVLKPGSTLITDKATAYQHLTRTLGVEHKAYDAKQQQGKLAPVNALHSKMKRFIRKFTGVASKYLPRYLAWMLWLDNHNLEQGAMDALNTQPYVTTRAGMGDGKLPPLNPLARKTLQQAMRQI